MPRMGQVRFWEVLDRLAHPGNLIQRRSSGQRKQTANRGIGKVVIGENMKARVIP